jgi:hypothetical protein
LPTSFRQPFTIIKRSTGQWVDGIYQFDYDYTNTESIMATVQMPSARDASTIESNPWGRRAARFIKIYTDSRLHVPQQATYYDRNTGQPSVLEVVGDIFLYDSRQFLLFGEFDFTMLSRSRATPVSHWRYFGIEAMEKVELTDGGP